MLCVIGKTIRMIMIELRMFSYNFAHDNERYTVLKESKTKLLFNEKSTNFEPQRKTAKAF